jgi:hypothetical protein
MNRRVSLRLAVALCIAVGFAGHYFGKNSVLQASAFKQPKAAQACSSFDYIKAEPVLGVYTNTTCVQEELTARLQ